MAVEVKLCGIGRTIIGKSRLLGCPSAPLGDRWDFDPRAEPKGKKTRLLQIQISLSIYLLLCIGGG